MKSHLRIEKKNGFIHVKTSKLKFVVGQKFGQNFPKKKQKSKKSKCFDISRKFNGEPLTSQNARPLLQTSKTFKIDLQIQPSHVAQCRINHFWYFF